MTPIEERLHQELSDAVVEFDEDKAIAASQEVIAQGLDAYKAIDHGLAHGMERAGKLFEDEVYFVPEILLSADAMYAGMNVLQPHIPHGSERKKVGSSSAWSRVIPTTSARTWSASCCRLPASRSMIWDAT